MYLTSALTTRNHFGAFLNDRGLLGSAVEIGTHRGDFAETFLETWKGQQLYCVDPWNIPADYKEQAKTLWGGETREQDYQFTKARLARFGDRVSYCRCLSMEAVKHFDPASLDFIHLDGNHDYPHVSQDLYSWWSRLRPGGVMSGHDIICPNEVDGGWGRFVQPAVQNFIWHELPVYLIVERDGSPWSFYFIKPLEETR